GAPSTLLCRSNRKQHISVLDGSGMLGALKPPCDAGIVSAGEQSVTCAKRIGVWVLVASVLGSSMAFIDGTAVNLALPALQTELKASGRDAQWIIESYALMLASLILVGGALGDQFGRRRIFSAGVLLFTIASVACGLAQTPGQLIVGRTVQGVGGALLIPG